MLCCCHHAIVLLFFVLKFFLSMPIYNSSKNSNYKSAKILWPINNGKTEEFKLFHVLYSLLSLLCYSVIMQFTSRSFISMRICNWSNSYNCKSSKISRFTNNKRVEKFGHSALLLLLCCSAILQCIYGFFTFTPICNLSNNSNNKFFKLFWFIKNKKVDEFGLYALLFLLYYYAIALVYFALRFFSLTLACNSLYSLNYESFKIFWPTNNEKVDELYVVWLIVIIWFVLWLVIIVWIIAWFIFAV